MYRYISLILCLTAGLITPLQLAALDSDSDQPIEVEADALEIRDDDNISTYSGNVSLVQGSMRIAADRLVIYFNDQNELVRMEMTGTPATFRQLNDDNREMRGQADRLDYDETSSLLVLTGNALFDNNGDTIQGSSIRLNTENEHIEASGDQSSERVRVVIQPKTKTENQ